MAEETPKTLNISELNRLYEAAETCDKELFSEQRSNILLSSGDHFQKAGVNIRDRVRDPARERSTQKLRLVYNLTHKITRTITNNIINLAPGVAPQPVDDKDLRHIKTAELNQAVWDYAKQKHNMRSKIQDWASNFVDIGEVFTKIFFDPNAGTFVGYEQEVDEMGEPLFEPALDHEGQPEMEIAQDPFGQPMMQPKMNPVPSDRAKFTGDIVFKTYLPANVKRAAEAKSIEESRFLCVVDMVDIDILKKMVGDDQEKLDLIKGTEDESFHVFDSRRGSYEQSRRQAMVREWYFRPSVEFPTGRFFICVQNGVLFEGELPFGIFPICYGGYDMIPTTPRHRSIIKQLRPIQSELNRAMSKIAEHQICLADDKIIMQNGSKVTSGAELPGIRTLSVTGQAPTILPGRTGDQYMPYVQQCIQQLFQIANVQEDGELKAGMDPWMQGFATMRDKKKFSMYAEKFEQFLVKVCETYLKLAKEYFDENMLIPAIGRADYINIAEFKNQDPLCVRIKVVPANDDMGTMMLKQLSINHALQFLGSSLKPDVTGKMLSEMPFANFKDAFSDLTIDYDSAVNVQLALDRGEQVQAQPHDNAEYILKRLSSRQKQADYRMLDPQIQQNYQTLMASYQQILVEQAQALKQAESQFIPSGGAMIKVDYYIPDPKNSDRSIRATIPAESVDWLIKQLSSQGSQQALLGELPQNQQAAIAQQSLQQGMPQRQMAPANDGMMPPQGGVSPSLQLLMNNTQGGMLR